MHNTLKDSKEFQLEEEIVFIVSNIKSADKFFLSIDKDLTVCKATSFIHQQLVKDYQLAYNNSRDQNNNFILTVPISEALRIHLLDGLATKFNHLVVFFINNTLILITEFIDPIDSQTQILLQNKPHHISKCNYFNFERSFERRFKLIKKNKIEGINRELFIYKKHQNSKAEVHKDKMVLFL